MPGSSGSRRTWGVAEQKIVASRQKWSCAHCLCLLPSSFELDHRIPLWAGGPDCWETNADALCPTCHANKTQREAIERSRLIRERRLAAIREAVPDLDLEIPPPGAINNEPQRPNLARVSDPLVDNNPFLKYAFVES